MVKNLPGMQETWFQFLGWEDPIKGMATHASILAWKIPGTEEPGGLQSMETHTHIHTPVLFTRTPHSFPNLLAYQL